MIFLVLFFFSSAIYTLLQYATNTFVLPKKTERSRNVAESVEGKKSKRNQKAKSKTIFSSRTILPPACARHKRNSRNNNRRGCRYLQQPLQMLNLVFVFFFGVFRKSTPTNPKQK